MSGKSQKLVTQQDIAEHPNARQVSWHGGYFSMCCPFHDDDSPSCLVYQDWFQCVAAGCEKGGRLYSLYKKLGVSPAFAEYAKAMRIPWSSLLDEFNRPRAEFIDEAVSGVQFPDVIKWYLDRGFSEEDVERYRLGYWRGWYVTPVYDDAHQPLRVVLRSGPSLYKKQYVTSPGDEVLYVPDWGLIHTKPQLLVVPFGVYDAITIAKCRYPAATPLAPTGNNASLFDRFRCSIYVLPDAEPPEEYEVARRLVIDLGYRGHLVKLPYNGLKDANDFLAAGKIKLLTEALGRECYA